MSNRDALRKLSKKFPPPPELKETLDALYEGSDLNAAIVGTALIEAGLERLLVGCLASNDKTLPGKLFENRGPLSDFNSKILTGQAFGMISEGMAQELHTIRHIRNVFAHSRVPVTFDTPQVAKEVRESGMMKAMAKVEDPSAREAIEAFPTKRAFILLIQILFIMLDNALKKRGGGSLLPH